MKKYLMIGIGLLTPVILIIVPTKLPAIDDVKPALQDDWSVPRESIGRRLRELLDRLKENFIFEVSGEDRAPISLMLRNRERLGLTADQVKHLEQLRNDFAKESIRSEANLRIAEMDLMSLLEAQPVDMTKAEAKIREIERIRGDLRIARIRSIEKGKAQLSAEQRRQLQELQADQNFAGLEFKNKP
jgi:Heavy-metal resistance